MSDSLKYSERIREVDSIISKLRSSNDVDEAITLFEVGCEHLAICRDKIEKAKGKYEEIITKQGLKE